MQSGKVCAIIVAAGASRRMGFDKLSYIVKGQTVLYKSVLAFDTHHLIDSLVIVTSEGLLSLAQEIAKSCSKPCKLLIGGATRQESVKRGVESTDAEYIAIHDAARPFVSAELITRTLTAAFEYKAAAPCVPLKDTIKRADSGGFVITTPKRSEMYAVQTPQIFATALYKSSLTYRQDLTDDCQIIENAGARVKLVEGEYTNYKITTRDDIKEYKAMRIGHGYDVHRLAANRKLILGGVQIDHVMGLDGHSDADVLTHAVMDALLGAAALGDIGLHFPDNSDEYEGANSICLLEAVMAKIKNSGYTLTNLDATILCQAPKLRLYIEKMRTNLAKAMCTDIKNISIKATTEEGLGFTGAGQGIAAHAVVLLEG